MEPRRAGLKRRRAADAGLSRKEQAAHILTDASPNDDRKIPPDRAGGHPLSRDYSGEAGIRDTSSEVRALKKSGVQVMAVLNGDDGSSEAARRIYGDDFVRIENIRRLSDAVGTLLQKKIERFF